MTSLGRRSPTMQGPVSSGRSYLSRLLPRPAWLLALTLGLASPASAQAPGTWAPIADLNQPRAEHTATLLASGTVLIAGGRDAADQPLASAEIYDPATRTFSPAPSALAVARQDHTATLLPDGRVLVAGGSDFSGALESAELYDPTAGTVSPAGPLNVPRTLASAALLLDGTVLVAGGQTTTSSDLDSAEIYDAATNTFARLTPPVGTAPSGP